MCEIPRLLANGDMCETQPLLVNANSSATCDIHTCKIWRLMGFSKVVNLHISALVISHKHINRILTVGLMHT